MTRLSGRDDCSVVRRLMRDRRTTITLRRQTNPVMAIFENDAGLELHNLQPPTQGRG